MPACPQGVIFMVNIELYRVFYTVAKCGSLTKAADELFISQPAVSQAIKQLESQLGTSLFNRTHRGMELSVQGGKLIFKQVEEALALLDAAENKLIELKTTASGTIRVGATDSIFLIYSRPKKFLVKRKISRRALRAYHRHHSGNAHAAKRE